MSQLKITKGHGCGMTVVIVHSAPDGSDIEIGQRVRELCDRRGAVGGQGLFFLEDRPAEPEVWYFDSSGWPTAPDGHGLRVVGRVVMDGRGTNQVVIRSGACRYAMRRLPNSPEGVVRVAIDLPAVDFAPKPPILVGGAGRLSDLVPGFRPDRQLSALAAPTPQLVCIVGGYDEKELIRFGERAAAHQSVVPLGADLSFLWPLNSDDEVFVRTFAQSAGLTKSHAAGMAACRVVYSQMRAVDPDMSLLMRSIGGPAHAAVRRTGQDWAVTLDGNATVLSSYTMDVSGLAPGQKPRFEHTADPEEGDAFQVLSRKNRKALEDEGLRLD
jgi:diaminopimelate epimerase